jgi:hypothetical protein
VVNSRDLTFFVCLVFAIVMSYLVIANTHEYMRSKIDVRVHYYMYLAGDFHDSFQQNIENISCGCQL